MPVLQILPADALQSFGQGQQPPADDGNQSDSTGAGGSCGGASNAGSLNSSADEDEDDIMAFEDQNGRDNANALADAIRSISSFKWDENDVKFNFTQLETRMAAAGVKKNFTKLQVITTI